ncbi:MAG TPA: hypothetical protein VMI13_08690 [Solirubrobacteraceae bacterium]|nr:hypothetical protein [Solirubrobacteraceae bacterium]
MAVVVATSLVLVAGSASASTPYFVECAKASPKNTGDYADSKCSSVTEPGKGKFTLKEGVGPGGGAFTGKTLYKNSEGHVVQLDIPGPFPTISIYCKKGTDSGKYALPNLMTGITNVWGKCGTSAGSSQCTSVGAASGEIRLAVMRGELGVVRKGGERAVMMESEQDPGGPIRRSSLR